jgi:hypothetical protein
VAASPTLRPAFEAPTVITAAAVPSAPDPVPRPAAPTRTAATEPPPTRRAEKALVPEVPNWDRSVPTGAEPAAPATAPAVAAPVAVPAVEAREERHVTVTIGRLEVKVVPPAAGAKPAAPAPPPTAGLADYLRRRGGGDR